MKMKNHFIPNTTKVSQQRITTFCETIDVQLPRDYQEFLIAYNGGKFATPPSFIIPRFSYSVQLECLYGFDYESPNSSLDLEKNYAYNFNYEMSGETLAIGHCQTEQGHLMVMMVNTEEISGIYLCDLFYDEFALSESEEDDNTFFIADTFESFFSKLL